MRWHEGYLQTLIVPAEALVVSFVQPFGEGVLLAGARCHWRPEGAEKNGVAIGWDGRELARFTFGDGIQNLRVTRDGTIWASYFDEGVFGNYGWSHPGTEAIGASGLVAFSTSGEIRFTYDPKAAHTDSICDAYAMNVAGDDDVWVYFYTEFSIVRILRGCYRVWSLGVGGARSIAVRGDRAVLFGDYTRHDLGRLVGLGQDGSATVTDELTLVDDQGRSLRDAGSCGIAGALYFFKDRRVLIVDDW